MVGFRRSFYIFSLRLVLVKMEERVEARSAYLRPRPDALEPGRGRSFVGMQDAGWMQDGRAGMQDAGWMHDGCRMHALV